MTPTRKVGTGALAGAVSIVLVWVLGNVIHIDVPATVASAITTIMTFVTSYLVPEAE